jgi:hypothetical protein
MGLPAVILEEDSVIEKKKIFFGYASQYALGRCSLTNSCVPINPGTGMPWRHIGANIIVTRAHKNLK